MAQTLSTQRESQSNTRCWIIVAFFWVCLFFHFCSLGWKKLSRNNRVWLGCVGFICQKVEKVLSTSVDKTQSWILCINGCVILLRGQLRLIITNSWFSSDFMNHFETSNVHWSRRNPSVWSKMICMQNMTWSSSIQNQKIVHYQCKESLCPLQVFHSKIISSINLFYILRIWFLKIHLAAPGERRKGLITCLCADLKVGKIKTSQAGQCIALFCLLLKGLQTGAGLSWQAMNRIHS